MKKRRRRRIRLKYRPAVQIPSKKYFVEEEEESEEESEESEEEEEQEQEEPEEEEDQEETDRTDTEVNTATTNLLTFSNSHTAGQPHVGDDEITPHTARLSKQPGPLHRTEHRVLRNSSVRQTRPRKQTRKKERKKTPHENEIQSEPPLAGVN